MSPMKYVTSVETTADPARVWEAWIDIERWPEWTRSVTSVQRLDSAEFGVGSRARITQPKTRPLVWEVTEVTPHRSFVWATRTAGTRMVASHRVEPRPDGTAIIRLSIDHTGALAGLLGRLIGRQIQAYLDIEAAGVKQRAESSEDHRP
jgi:uncharacterized membrane protein